MDNTLGILGKGDGAGKGPANHFGRPPFFMLLNQERREAEEKNSGNRKGMWVYSKRIPLSMNTKFNRL